MASSYSGSSRPKYFHFNPNTFLTASSISLFLMCCMLLVFLFLSLSSLYGSFPFLNQVPEGTQFIRPVHGSNRDKPKSKSCTGLPLNLCKYQEGSWIYDGAKRPLYNEQCPFQRNAWNCIKNARPNMDTISGWKWVPKRCELPQINPHLFLKSVRNMNIGFVGDSLNENLLVSFLCILRTADEGARKWKRKGAWKGAYFPKFNVTVGYHRAVLLAKYEWQPANVTSHSVQHGVKGTYRVDVDIPADDWVNVTNYYDVYIFNTGHWWSSVKFPKETPLMFHKEGKLISPTLSIRDGAGGKVTKTENALFELYKSIHQKLQECISSEGKRGGVCIMIDDLSLLEIVAHGSEEHVLDFLHYCRILTSEQGCSLVLLSHQDIYASMDNSSFIRHLEYFADTVIDVEPLNSGLAADIHGQLTVFHRSNHEDISNMGSGPRNMLHNFHFRVKENQVEYFLPGKQI